MHGSIIQGEVLRRFCTDSFGKFGFSVKQSETITDILLLSDLLGIESHGMQRLVRYHKGIQNGLIKVGAEACTVMDTPVSAVIDGNDGMGQLLGYDAMNLAIQKAQASGVAVVTVRNSNHFGIAGYYAKMASDRGLIGIAMTNSEAIMVPTNSKLAMLGSNPIALAVPAEPFPFLFDASTTVVTRGKLELYDKKEKPLPQGWALDENGQGCTDSRRVLENIIGKRGGGIMPLGGDNETSGGHKGYGFGMFCEIFCSILSMGITSNHTHQNGKGGTCHGFICINPAFFGDPKQIKERFSAFLQELRDAPLAEGAARIYTHGEKEAIAYERRLSEGVEINLKTLAEMMALAKDVSLDFASYFGELDIPEYFSGSYSK